MSESTNTTNLPVRAMEDVSQAIDNKMSALSGNRQVFQSSFNTETHEGKLKLINALAASEDISDHLDEVINMTDYVAQVVEFLNEDNQLTEGIRIIIVDDEGNSYAALSDGLLKSLQMFVSVMGHPSTWPGPLPIVVSRVKSRRGFLFYTAKLA